MQTNEVIKWYEENTDTNLNKYFLNKMIEMGMINPDIDINILNLFLLERFNDNFIIENGKYRVKKNRLPLISQMIPVEQPKNEKVEQMKKAVEKLEEKPKRFKIEKLNGNRLKLVKK